MRSLIILYINFNVESAGKGILKIGPDKVMMREYCPDFFYTR